MVEKWNSYQHSPTVKFTTPLPCNKLLSYIPKNASVLDLWCWYWRVLSHLVDLWYQNLSWIDVSHSLVNRAKDNCPSVDLHIGNIENYKFDKKFDLILIMWVIEYILKDKDQEDFFSKVNELLNIWWYILLESFIMDYKLNWQNYLSWFLKTWHLWRFSNSKWFNCHHQTEEQLSAMLKKKFLIVSEIREKYLTWTWSECNWFTIILKKNKEYKF